MSPIGRLNLMTFVSSYRARTTLRATALSCVVAACSAPFGSALAGGFYVPEIGARAIALAGANVANNSGVTSIFHNPAGLAGIGGTQIQLNAMGAMANINYWRRPIKNADGSLTGFDKVSNSNGFGVVPSLFAGSNFGLKNWGFGVGVYVPFGAHIEYPEDGAQRYSIVEASLRNFYVTPTVSYRFSERWSVGVGISYVASTIDLRQASSAVFVLGNPQDNPNPDPEFDGSNHLKGKDSASLSANLGILYQDPKGRYSVGFSAMLPTTIDFRGDALIQNDTIMGQEAFEEGFGEGLEEGKREEKFHMQFQHPLVLRAGVHLKPHPRLSINADVNWQRWSSSKELEIDFENNFQLQPIPGATLYDVKIPQRWKDTLTVRLGMEARPAAKLPLFLRAGALFDQSPVKDMYFDMMTPDSDKFGLSAGAGYQIALGEKFRLNVDLAWLRLYMKERNIRPLAVGPQVKSGQDDNEPDLDDSIENEDFQLIPGSAKTILNKPAASYHYGVTRASANLLGLTIALRM